MSRPIIGQSAWPRDPLARVDVVNSAATAIVDASAAAARRVSAMTSSSVRSYEEHEDREDTQTVRGAGAADHWRRHEPSQPLIARLFCDVNFDDRRRARIMDAGTHESLMSRP